ncbi:MAG TPA: RNA-binding S4 domain-containing protein [Lacunisphaera sp.]|nr:RNA-binding S4 domain-containing protein [Lacunisphaera sp.]
MLDSSSADPAKAEPIVVREVPIELCQFMKFAGLTETGGEAKQLIGAGQVLVNGVVEIRKRRKLVAGDQVSHGGRTAVVRLAT